MTLGTAARAAPDEGVGKRTHRLHFPALERRIECREDETVFAAARRAGLRIVGACGGRGSCGSSVVRVSEGRVHRDGEAGHRQWLRACRVQPRSDLTLDVAPRSLAPVVRADVRTGGEDAPLPLRPAVQALDVQVAPASLHDPASDMARVRRVLAGPPATVGAATVAELPELLRAHGGRVGVRMTAGPTRGAPRRLIGFTRPGAPLLGLAVDLGTTNAAAFLVDLASGQRLASLGLENPQVAWGADLVSRIDHAIQQPGAADALRRAALTAINALAHDLARAVGAQAGDIADVAVCGNTAMQHLLAGWPVAQLGRAPFVAATSEALDVPARELGIEVGSGAAVHLAPGIGGFIGGDHVCALLATEPLWQPPGDGARKAAPGSAQPGGAVRAADPAVRHTLVMDIGTNTEISLVRHGDGSCRIWSASCPSGPALEGGHIGSGMRAAEGAIEGAAIVDGALNLSVIGGGMPVGLCGSGVLDALAAFVGAGWVDARGRIAAGAPGAGEAGGARAITLAEERPQTCRFASGPPRGSSQLGSGPSSTRETAAAPAVRLTQHDVRAVQLAKSAIRTGVQLLAAEAGLAEADIDRFVIAGAFGAYLRVESGIAIGLLPPLPRERFVQVGNAAGLGVQQLLASTERRARAARLAADCRYVELGARGDFQKTFLHHLGFAS